MADIKERIIFDDSAVIKSLTDQYNLVTKVNVAIRESEMTYKEAYDVAKKQIDSTNEVIEDGTKVIGEHTAETIKAKTASKGWGSAMKGLADEVNIMGVNLGRTIDQLRAKAAAMKSVVSSVNAGSSAMKAFKIALISTGVGALVVALGSLVAMLSRSEGAMKKVNQVLAGIGAVVDLVITRFAKIGDAVVKVFQGDFRGAMKSASESTEGLTAAIGKQYDAAVKLERKIQELEATNRSLALSTEFVKGKIDALVDVYNDQTNKAEERIAALNEAAKLDVENLKLLEKAAIQATANEVDRQMIAYNKINDQEALNEKLIAQVAATNAVEAASDQYLKKTSGLENEIASKRAEDNAKRLEEIKKINQALQDQIDKIANAFQKVQLDKLGPEERVQAEAEIAKRIIDEQFKLLDEYAKAANRQVDMTKEKAALILAVEEDAAKQIKAIREGSLKEVAEIEDLGTIKSKERLDGILAHMQEIEPKETKALTTPFQEMKDAVAVALGLTKQELEDVLSGLGDIINAAFDAMGAATERAIAGNDEILAGIRERQDLLDDELDKEKERADAGLANNLSAKDKEREALKKEEAATLKEQEKLQKKALAQQILADSLQQASSIATMAANVTKGTSLLGPAGIPIAIATIAAFIAIIAKIKSGSKKLYKGGPLDQDGVTGFVNKSGRSDLNGGRGHAVQDSNLILGGKEFVVNERTSMKHAAFLEALNRGEFDAGDGLHFAMGHAKEMSHNSAIVGAMNDRRSSAGQAEAIAAAVGRQMQGLASVIRSMPSHYAYSPGDIVVEVKGGATKIKQTEPDWRWKPEGRG